MSESAERHRQTAAEWHGGQSSPLYAFASTGNVVPGIVEEIEVCLAVAERGLLDAGVDPDGQPERLRELLLYVHPESATAKAREVGREHAKNAAAWWQQGALGGRATGDSAAVARRVLQGLDDGDPAIIDMLPGPVEGYTATELPVDSGWPEPLLEHRSDHARWDAAQPAIADAYTTAFIDEVWASVTQACRSELADGEPNLADPAEAPASEQQTRPVLRSVGGITEVPRGWVTASAGRNGRGEDIEVVYDPGHYDVLVVHGERGGTFPRLAQEASADLMLDALAVTGWELYGFAGKACVWVRDRAEAERLAAEHREAGRQPEVQFYDLGPTRPFLRREGSIDSIPAGWIAESAGVAGASSDVLVEVVYNPQRHEVMRVPKSRSQAVLGALGDQGWTQASGDAISDLLWRDRIAHVRNRLERSTAQSAVEIEGPGL